jgi:hypothetical protein
MSDYAMTDAELIAFLGLSDAEAKIILPKITPEKRRAYEVVAAHYEAILKWQKGLGPIPAGVIPTFDRRRKW